ncbi:tetratricopeptide repeat protein [Myxococcus landrumensis]|uniref:Tetratricopeptide repeat protein n=1 Tax=Myxococcus landrumensis TaxID=2813577 RepID=A0ABX7NAU8_9BACT|nr:tetratricopeptide repeat protein [Myxococcus landrumus]QSQ15519.1 tetratricopeptide repeat protein [Myxococcus landrumus]
MVPRPVLIGCAVVAVFAGGFLRWWREPSRGAGPPGAETSLERLARLDRESSPDDAVAQGRLATEWVRLGLRSEDSQHLLRARIAARRALLIDPERVDALKVELLLLHHDHRFRELRDAAAGLAEQSPPDAFFVGLLGDAELELGRYDEAEAAYQRMMDLKPSHATYTRVGYLRLLLGDVDGAISVLKLAADSVDRRDGDSVARALCELGDAYLAKGSPDTAFEYFTVALTHSPALDRAHVGRGHVLRSRGQPEAAAEEYRVAVASRPRAGHRAFLADALAAAGHEEEARAESTRAVHDVADDAREHARLLLEQGGDLAQAEALARQEMTHRQDVFTQAVLAHALVSAGKVEEARPLAAAAVRLGTRNARLHHVAGLVEAASGNRDAARHHLDAALRGFPPLSPRAEAKARAMLEAWTPPANVGARAEGKHLP